MTEKYAEGQAAGLKCNNCCWWKCADESSRRITLAAQAMVYVPNKLWLVVLALYSAIGAFLSLGLLLFTNNVETIVIVAYYVVFPLVTATMSYVYPGIVANMLSVFIGIVIYLGLSLSVVNRMATRSLIINEIVAVALICSLIAIVEPLLIRGYRRVGTPPCGYCKRCGYCMRGLRAPICPECGWRGVPPENSIWTKLKSREKA